MKTLLFALLSLSVYPLIAQYNCNLYPEGSDCRKGCEKYLQTFESWPGTKKEQLYLDSAISLCPSFAEAYKAKSASYLRSGQIRQWKVLIDKAVELDSSNLRARAWGYFKFLKDYEFALEDLLKISNLNSGFPGQSEDGDYDLRIVIALCYRELGNHEKALEMFDISISENEVKKKIGPFDYLHRGVLKLKIRNYQGALDDFQKQMNVYENFADAHYYLGMANKELGNTIVAHLNFKEAKELFDRNLHRWDAYCEEIDLVYYEDILKEIKNTQ